MKKKAKLTLALYGGLGNQMFQYAFAKNLSILNKIPLTLDLYGFKFDTFYKRKFDLQNFNISAKNIKENSFLKFHLSRFLFKSPDFIKSFFRVFIVVENRFKHNSSILNEHIKKDLYLFGYWQDEKYFLDIRKKIKKEFSPVKKISSRNIDLLKKIKKNSNSVAVHVRQFHGVSRQTITRNQNNLFNPSCYLSKDYYVKAINLIKQNTPKATFFIFSDDPLWAKNNLNFVSNAYFLDNDRGDDYEDLILMSKCKHHIIANSSFSWWGAWLANTKGQVVISPKQFKYTPTIPKRWISI
jgi:hypothetical protein